jgi:hypothetical protein
MAITDVAQNIIWATTPGTYSGTVSFGPFPPSHIKAKTSLQKLIELDDVSFVDTYIAQFVQGGAPHPVYQGTCERWWHYALGGKRKLSPH